ncbi:MAG: GxxExxY protein [Candidatus Wildermuthbacteria bacterium]|nr:GxxExxY protein [Candidatus Wildermuthbacteria bacterium]
MQTTEKEKDKVLFRGLSYRLTGIFFRVHNQLGRFRNEKQYGDGIAHELLQEKILFQREYALPLSFQGEELGRNKIDFIIDDAIIVEIKAKHILMKDDYYQMKRYLVTMDKELGILVNFRQKYLTPKRVLHM